MQQLLKLRQEKHVIQRLGQLPQGLKEAYREIVNGMEEHEFLYFDRAMQWVMRYLDDVTRKVMTDVVCQDPESDVVEWHSDLNEEILLEYCHNLIIMDSRGVWRASHLSVIEFYELEIRTRTEADWLIATTCLKMLLDEDERAQFRKYCELDNPQPDSSRKSPTGHSRDDQESISSVDKSNFVQRPRVMHERTKEEVLDSLDNDQLKSRSVLYTYAVEHWGWHINGSNCTPGSEHANRLGSLLGQFLGSPCKSTLAYDDWCDARQILRSSDLFSGLDVERGFPAYTICRFRLYHELYDWWKDESHWRLTKEQLRELLAHAIYRGSEPICERLIDFGAELNTSLSRWAIANPSMGTTSPLSLAALYHAEGLVYLFLRRGADINMMVPPVSGLHDSFHSHHREAGQDHLSPHLITTMRAHPIMECKTALSEVISSPYREVKVLPLLDNGAAIDTYHSCGCWNNSLQAAVRSRRSNVLSLLLGKCADLTSNPLQLGLPLATAIESGYQEGFISLLAQNPDVNACLWPYHKLENLLMVAISSVGSRLASSHLKYSNDSGHELQSITRIKRLVEKGANVNFLTQYTHYGSPLAMAAKLGRVQIMKMLLELGADVNLQLSTGRYRNALHAARAGLSTASERWKAWRRDSWKNVDDAKLLKSCEFPPASDTSYNCAIDILLQAGAIDEVDDKLLSSISLGDITPGFLDEDQSVIGIDENE